MTTEAEPEITRPEGFGVDTCDAKNCGQRAWIWVTMPSRKPLTFCGHHGRLYMPKLAADGARVVDMTHLILEVY